MDMDTKIQHSVTELICQKFDLDVQNHFTYSVQLYYDQLNYSQIYQMQIN